MGKTPRGVFYLVLVLPDFDPNGSGIPDFGHSPTINTTDEATTIPAGLRYSQSARRWPILNNIILTDFWSPPLIRCMAKPPRTIVGGPGARSGAQSIAGRLVLSLMSDT